MVLFFISDLIPQRISRIAWFASVAMVAHTAAVTSPKSFTLYTMNPP
jgi:hypothetical protein